MPLCKLRKAAFLDTHGERAYNHPFVIVAVGWTVGP